MRNLKSALRNSALLATITIPAFLLMETAGCHETPAQVTAITQAGAQELECVATAALNGGITDPMVIASLCGGLTIQTIVTIIDTLFAGSAGVPTLADAGPESGAPSASDGGPALASAMRPRLFVFTPAEKARLLDVQTRAKTLLASKSASK